MAGIKNLVLYASYQTGDTLPGYVQFALKHLAETGFTVVLLTNQRELSVQTSEFLNDNGIQLFMTENHGFDFGMWRRYLKSKMQIGMQSVERIVLMNDSIVYFQNKFAEYFQRAEACGADVVSLTQCNEISPHLQSYFMYMKQEALGAFYLHMLETPEQETFQGVVERYEVGLARVFKEAEVSMAALYENEGQVMLANQRLIQQGAGFVKRKLLQRRFSTADKLHFVRQGSIDSLNADYLGMVKSAGLSPDFKEEWLPKPLESNLKHQVDLLWEGAVKRVGWPLLRTAIKAKYKILRRELKGDEYK